MILRPGNKSELVSLFAPPDIGMGRSYERESRRVVYVENKRR
jgi:hypothetical protein